jgi:preprotein translocase subunit YajC
MYKIFEYKNKILVGFVAIFFFSLALTASALTAEQQKRCDDFRKGFEVKTDNPNLKVDGKNIFISDGLPTFCTVEDLVSGAIDLLLVASGTITVLFIMLGGFWYLTSAGNEEQAEKGQKTLTYAVIGLVVIIMSFVIVRIVAGTLNTAVPGSDSATPPSSQTPPVTPPAGTQTPPETPDSSGNVGDLIIFEDWLTPIIPPTADEGRRYTVAVEFSESQLESFKSFCGQTDPLKTNLKATLDGKNTALIAPFIKQENKYRAEASVASFVPATVGERVESIILKICDDNKDVASRNILFKSPTSVSPR